MKTTNFAHPALIRLLILILAMLMVFTFSPITKYAFADDEASDEEAAEETTEEAADEESEEASEEAEEETPAPLPVLKYKPVSPSYVINPLTGERSTDKSKTVKTRVVGVVVENHPEARPQWGMEDPYYAPDIILEGEVEGGISRMLWMWGDYNKMPDYVGPVRSARPPFVRFSELFNAMFIHWGMSESSGAYTGADYYFNNDGVDHIDGMYYESSGPFDRMSGTGRASEHTAIVYGSLLPGYLEEYFNTERNPDLTTSLKFHKYKEVRGEPGSCSDVFIQFSSISKSTDWYYWAPDQKYYTYDFENNASRDNILVLMDTTTYVSKVENYASYCNYDFSGGDAYLASCGAVQYIKWTVEDGKLKLYDPETGEDVPLNPGKTYIGWASSNNGGYCTITAGETAPKAEASPLVCYQEWEPEYK